MIRSPCSGWFRFKRIVRLPRGTRGSSGTWWFVIVMMTIASSMAVFAPSMVNAQGTTVGSAPGVIVEETDVEGATDEAALGPNEFFGVGGTKVTLPESSLIGPDTNWPAVVRMECTVEAEKVTEGVAVRVVKGSCGPVGGRRLSFNGSGKLTPFTRAEMRPTADGANTVEVFVIVVVLRDSGNRHFYVTEPRVEIPLVPPEGPKWTAKGVDFKFDHKPPAAAAAAPPAAAPPARGPRRR